MVEQEDGTQPRQIRVNGDIADMLSWIEHFEKPNTGETIAQIVDPMIRAKVMHRYGRWKEKAEAVAKAMGEEVQEGRIPTPPKSRKRGQ